MLRRKPVTRCANPSSEKVRQPRRDGEVVLWAPDEKATTKEIENDLWTTRDTPRIHPLNPYSIDLGIFSMSAYFVKNLAASWRSNVRVLLPKSGQSFYGEVESLPVCGA
jgi:hypothetical protein